MKILMVSWEYPPVVIGGLGRHVHHVATALADQGHDVVVLSRHPFGADALTHPTSDIVSEGVRVIAVAEDPPTFEFGSDMLAWTLAMGHAMVRAGLELARSDQDGWTPDVVHAHDWLVAHPAITLAQYFDIPLVATLHATEAGRHSGWLSGRINAQVHSVEWWLAHDADALIACSTSMRTEIEQLYGPGLAEVTVIANGIDLAAWPYRAPTANDGPPRLLYVGRLEYEKGVQDLIAALPRIRRRFPGTTLDIAGEGTQYDWLIGIAREKRVLRSVRFLGRLDHAGLIDALHGTDAVVLPSRYEPFGIAALEAAACGAPLVTSTAGGLGEAVTERVTGASFAPGDVAGLTAAVSRTLADPSAARAMAAMARSRLATDFDWPGIAAHTVSVYESAKRRPRSGLGKPLIPQRPLPDRD